MPSYSSFFTFSLVFACLFAITFGAAIPLTTRQDLTTNLARVCIDKDFSGNCAFLTTGTDGFIQSCNDLPAGFSDSISSIETVLPGITCTFFVDAGCQGSTFVLDSFTSPSQNDLSTTDFNDNLSTWTCSQSQVDPNLHGPL